MSFLSVPALVLAVVLSCPAIWRYSEGELSFDTLLVRYVAIAVACLATAAVVRRYLSPASTQPVPGLLAVDRAEAAATAAAADPSLDPAMALLATEG